MESELIIISEYCSQSNIEKNFISLLENEGLIATEWHDGIQYLPAAQLGDVERYANWYYDLSINIEGIDTIRTLLNRIDKMQSELNDLRSLIDSFRDRESFDFDNDLFN